MATANEPSERVRVRRLAKRGVYDRAVIDQILDEGVVCHVGIVEDGQPFVIPMAYSRLGDRIYLHGSRASRLLKALAAGTPACITVTLLDGLVLARSAFHHSMNYRSAVVLGAGVAVEEPAEKVEALRMLLERLVPGRWDEIRAPSKTELQQTLVVAVPIEEASAKVRTGPPLDEEEDLALAVWAGVLPLQLGALAPVADPQLPASIAAPNYLSGWQPGSHS
jgi:nitroimidazol reductase NimA-like FMN-containing flavoprotein (pyridoxamine 5'-phosphate oxidase superfamily)